MAAAPRHLPGEIPIFPRYQLLKRLRTGAAQPGIPHQRLFDLPSGRRHNCEAGGGRSARGTPTAPAAAPSLPAAQAASTLPAAADPPLACPVTPCSTAAVAQTITPALLAASCTAPAVPSLTTQPSNTLARLLPACLIPVARSASLTAPASRKPPTSAIKFYLTRTTIKPHFTAAFASHGLTTPLAAHAFAAAGITCAAAADRRRVRCCCCIRASVAVLLL